MKLKNKSINYVVNLEKKTITCIIKSYFDFQEIVRYSLYYGKLPDHEFVSVGIARLKDGDTWNEEIGKRIAESKAKRKAYHSALNCLKKINSNLIKASDVLFDKIGLFMMQEDTEKMRIRAMSRYQK